MTGFLRSLTVVAVGLTFVGTLVYAGESSIGCRIGSVYEAKGSELTLASTSNLYWKGDTKRYLPLCLNASKEGSLGSSHQDFSFVGDLISSDVTFVQPGLKIIGRLKVRKGVTVGLSPRCHIKSNYFSSAHRIMFQAEGNLSFDYTPDGGLVACVEQAMVGIGPRLNESFFHSMTFAGSEISFSVDSYDFEGRVVTMPSGEL